MVSWTVGSESGLIYACLVNFSARYRLVLLLAGSALLDPTVKRVALVARTSDGALFYRYLALAKL